MHRPAGSPQGCAAHVAACRRRFGCRQYHPDRQDFDHRGVRHSPYKSLEIIAADARLIVGCITGSWGNRVFRSNAISREWFVRGDSPKFSRCDGDCLMSFCLEFAILKLIIYYFRPRLITKCLTLKLWILLLFGIRPLVEAIVISVRALLK